MLCCTSNLRYHWDQISQRHEFDPTTFFLIVGLGISFGNLLFTNQNKLKITMLLISLIANIAVTTVTAQCTTTACYGMAPIFDESACMTLNGIRYCCCTGTQEMCRSEEDCGGVCNTEWWTGNCDVPICQNAPCGNNAECSYPPMCSCKAGWTGSNCDTFVCDAGCPSNALCTGPNQCDCLPGWEDETCDTPICTTACEGNTFCSSPNTCSCLDGWAEPDCATPTCTMTCVNGDCTAPNFCECADGWMGVTCDTAQTTASDCNGRGEASTGFGCECNFLWTGDDCEEAKLGVFIIGGVVAFLSMIFFCVMCQPSKKPSATGEDISLLPPA